MGFTPALLKSSSDGRKVLVKVMRIRGSSTNPLFLKNVFSAIGSVNGHLQKLRARASRALLKNQAFFERSPSPILSNHDELTSLATRTPPYVTQESIKALCRAM